MDPQPQAEAQSAGPAVRTKLVRNAKGHYQWELSCTIPLEPGDDPHKAMLTAQQVVEGANHNWEGRYVQEDKT